MGHRSLLTTAQRDELAALVDLVNRIGCEPEVPAAPPVHSFRERMGRVSQLRLVRPPMARLEARLVVAELAREALLELEQMTREYDREDQLEWLAMMEPVN